MLRKAKDWSQVELAARTGIKQPSISDIERGETTPENISAVVLLALAKRLGVNPQFLLTGEEMPSAPEHPSIEESELLAIYRELSKSGKAGALLGAARGMLEEANPKPSPARPFRKATVKT